MLLITESQIFRGRGWGGSSGETFALIPEAWEVFYPLGSQGSCRPSTTVSLGTQDVTSCLSPWRLQKKCKIGALCPKDLWKILSWVLEQSSQAIPTV